MPSKSLIDSVLNQVAVLFVEFQSLMEQDRAPYEIESHIHVINTLFNVIASSSFTSTERQKIIDELTLNKDVLDSTNSDDAILMANLGIKLNSILEKLHVN